MPFIYLIDTVLTLYMWVLIIGVALSWLITFNVINGHNQLVHNIYMFCSALTEPVLKRIRAVVPPINGIDISPLILILGIGFIRSCLVWWVAPMLVRSAVYTL